MRGHVVRFNYDAVEGWHFDSLFLHSKGKGGRLVRDMKWEGGERDGSGDCLAWIARTLVYLNISEKSLSMGYRVQFMEVWVTII